MREIFRKYEDKNGNLIEISYNLEPGIYTRYDSFGNCFLGKKFVDFFIYENKEIFDRYIIDVKNQSERALILKTMEESLKNRLSATEIRNMLEKKLGNRKKPEESADLSEGQTKELEKLLDRHLKWKTTKN